MTTYFQSSNNQRETLPNLYLREPLPGSYSEKVVLPGSAMMYMNYASSSGSYSDALAMDPQQQSNCIDISSVGTSGSSTSQLEILRNLGGPQIVEHDFGSCRDDRNEMLLMHPMNGPGIIDRSVQNLQGQGLSLSLGTQMSSGIHISSIQYKNPNSSFSLLLSEQIRNAEDLAPHTFPGSNLESVKQNISLCGMSNSERTIQNSKYLKVVQQLLDEVVSVQKVLKDQESKKMLMKDSKENDVGLRDAKSVPPTIEEASNPRENSSNSHNELSASEKQDLENKTSKLSSMLDEVDTRYRQYYHQMQIVVSSFDAIAGRGAAKPYTALALQTISRQFRCLRDSINGQIRGMLGSLGEQDASGKGKRIAISRLRFVDQQLRRQQALQQLGVMQQHTWRPQRGLPESSVSILRAWMFEHFLHPYPTDPEKAILARQAGLTRSQVSNWFINARVRLWKPMVEEMYKEEVGDPEMDSNSSSDIVNHNGKGDKKASKDTGDDLKQNASSVVTGQVFESQYDVENEMAVATTTESRLQNPTSGGTNPECALQRLREGYGPGENNCSLFPGALVGPSGDSESFVAAGAAAYHLPELRRFGSVSGVSLTLGLQHCEGASIPISVHNHHGFVDISRDEVYKPSVSGHETADFDCIDSGNQQHRFGPSHMLHDFVA